LAGVLHVHALQPRVSLTPVNSTCGWVYPTAGHIDAPACTMHAAGSKGALGVRAQTWPFGQSACADASGEAQVRAWLVQVASGIATVACGAQEPLVTGTVTV
jgi:hypothetical protein